MIKLLLSDLHVHVWTPHVNVWAHQLVVTCIPLSVEWASSSFWPCPCSNHEKANRSLRSKKTSEPPQDPGWKFNGRRWLHTFCQETTFKGDTASGQTRTNQEEGCHRVWRHVGYAGWRGSHWTSWWVELVLKVGGVWVHVVGRTCTCVIYSIMFRCSSKIRRDITHNDDVTIITIPYHSKSVKALNVVLLCVTILMWLK